MGFDPILKQTPALALALTSPESVVFSMSRITIDPSACPLTTARPDEVQHREVTAPTPQGLAGRVVTRRWFWRGGGGGGGDGEEEGGRGGSGGGLRVVGTGAPK